LQKPFMTVSIALPRPPGRRPMSLLLRQGHGHGQLT